MTVRTTSASGVKWRRRLTKKLSSLRPGQQYTGFLDGFLFRGKNYKGKVSGLVLDLPTKMLAANSAYDTTAEGTFVSPVVTMDASRDLFSPLTGVTIVDPATARSTVPFEDPVEGELEFVFASQAPATGDRGAIYRTGQPYSGTGVCRQSYAFSDSQTTVNYTPLTDPPLFWVRSSMRKVARKSTVRVAISEDFVFSDTGGYRFYSRATDKTVYPYPMPGVTCDRRTVFIDGVERDIAVMAVPVVKNTAPYDATTNNTDYGLTGVYFFRMEIFSEAGRPVSVTQLDSGVVGRESVVSGPLYTPLWGEDLGASGGGQFNAQTGRLPNYVEGDVALTEAGDIFWVGAWQSSRETTTQSPDNYHVQIRNLVSITLSFAGALGFSLHYTMVQSNAASLGATFGSYLTLDSDTSKMPFMRHFQCFAPPGVAPFFVAEVVNLERSTVSILPSQTASLVVGDMASARFVPIPDGAFEVPDTPLNIDLNTYGGLSGEGAVVGPRIALVDANLQHPKVGLAIRAETSYSTVKWLELNLTTDTLTARGVVTLTAGADWDVQPAATCFQRGQSVTDPLGSTQTAASGVLFSYGVAGVGYTWLSKDSGQTWQQIEEYAARTGAYYFGSGFFGAALDQMYYEVNDNG